MAKLKPPKDAESANSELARGAHDTASEIRAIVGRLASVKSLKAAQSLLGKVGNPKGGRETDQALGELQRKGYTKAS